MAEKRKAIMTEKKKTLTFYVTEDGDVSLKPMGEDDEGCFHIGSTELKKLGISTAMKRKHKDSVVNAKVTITVDSIEYGTLGVPTWITL